MSGSRPERTPARQRLILTLSLAEAGALDVLGEALPAGDVAAVVLSDGTEAVVAEAINRCQAAGAAALVARGTAIQTADGVHATGSLDERIAMVSSHEDAMIAGAEAGSKHDAMLLGEAGAHYLWFGEADRPSGTALDLAAWWSALFEVPAVAAGAAGPDDVPKLIATGAEFIALGRAVLGDSAETAKNVARADALLRTA